MLELFEGDAPMEKNDRKKDEKEPKKEGRHLIEETVPSYPPEEPKHSKHLEMMIAKAPKEPNEVSFLIKKKPAKHEEKESRTGENECE